MTRFAVIMFYLLSLAIQGKTDNPCNVMLPFDSGEWGTGIVWLKKDSKLKLRDLNGDVIGSAYREPKYGQLKLEFKDRNEQGNHYNDIVAAGHSSVALIKVYGTTGQRHRVFQQMNDSEIWITVDDLEDARGKFLTYEQMLFAERETLPDEVQWLLEMANIGVNLSKIFLNLRAEPSIQAEKIRCISGNSWSTDFHTHFIIKGYKDGWALVESTQYRYAPELDDSGEDCAFEETRKETGWVKAIDDNGSPNIWFSVTSY